MRHALLALAISCLTVFGQEPPPAGPAQTAPRVEDRLNLWPLLYVDGDEVSVLAPIFRRTDDSVALRPLFSWKSSQQRLRVLYPLMEFNLAAGDGFVFPVFWGNDYTVGFPLYWDLRDANGRTNTLLPVWYYSREGADRSWWAAFGLIGGRQADGESHHRVLPLYSVTGNAHGYSHWYAPPLAHFWQDTRTKESGGWVIPFYLRRESPSASLSLSPLWASWENRDDGSRGHAVIPLYARADRADGRSIWTLAGADHRDGPAHRWWWWPLLSAGESAPGSSSYWAPFPLVRHEEDAAGSRHFVVPFYLRQTFADRSLLVTPVYVRRDGPGGSLRAIPPLLSWTRSQGDEHTAWYAAPFARVARTADSVTRHLFPVFYQRKAPGEEIFATLLGGRIRAKDREVHAIYPLLSWRTVRADRTDTWALAPFVHFSSGEKPGPSHVVPLYYNNPNTGALVSAPYARWSDEQGAEWRALPLLATWWSNGAGGLRGRLLAGLGGAGGTAEAGWRYLFPFIYQNRANGLTASPVYATWRDANGTNWKSVPPLLSWWNATEAGVQGRFLAGLAGAEGFGDERTDWVLPLYYRDRARDLLVTPLHGSWRDAAGGRHQVLPLLLSWWGEGPDGASRYLFGGLAGYGGGGTNRWSYAVPFYYENAAGDLLTPVAGRLTMADRVWRYWATPLAGSFTSAKETSSYVFPLASWSATKDGTSRSTRVLWGRSWREPSSRGSSFFPLWNARASTWGDGPVKSERDFFNICFLSRWSRSVTPTEHGARVESSYRLFPLWHRSESVRPGPTRGEVSDRSSLLGLYRNRVEREDGRVVAEKKRFLWYLYRRDRKGDDVRTDIFPAITHDRLADGYEKTSFLWRVYRRELFPDGRSQTSLLGIRF